MTERPSEPGNDPYRNLIDVALGFATGTVFYIPLFWGVFLPLGSWFLAVPAVLGLMVGRFAVSTTGVSMGFLLGCVPPVLLSGIPRDSSFYAVCGVMAVPFTLATLLTRWLSARSRHARAQRNTPGSGGATSG